MSVKYAFDKKGERLFGVAYEFRNEAQKDVVLGILKGVFPEITAIRSFTSTGVRPFKVVEFLDGLQMSGASAAELEQVMVGFEERILSR